MALRSREFASHRKPETRRRVEFRRGFDQTAHHLPTHLEPHPMLPAPRASLAANSAEFESFPLVKPTGFREYDARWWFGIPGAEKPPELNLLGVQALGLGLGTL